jgi:hypothetical protein
MKMIQEKHWLDQGFLYHGCKYCYMRWRNIKLGKEKPLGDSDDIL